MSNGKQGSGRPLVPEDEKHTKAIPLRVTHQEKELFKQCAKKRSLSVNAFLREAGKMLAEKTLGKAPSL